MKKTAYVISVAAILILLTGCVKNFLPAGSEITTYEIVRVLGIDRYGDNEVEVTLIAGRAKPSPGEEGGGMSYEIMSAAAPTAFEAVSKIRAETDKKQVFGYVDYIVFGENTASGDFAQYADFPGRSPEIRYSPKVFITRDMSAKELLSNTSSADKYIGDSLDNLSKNVSDRSDFILVRNIELMNMLDKKDEAVIIPAITANTPEEGVLIGGELPEKELKALGYAVLCDEKLVGYFDGANARAYNFLTGDIRSCTYSVEDPGGGLVGFSVLSEDYNIIPHWQSGRLTGVTVSLRAGAGVAEQRSRVGDNASAERIYALGSKLESAIESELTEAISKSKEFGIDCFGIGKRIKMAHPYKWRAIESSWREVYEGLEIKAQAQVFIRRAYDIREPSGIF